MYVQVKYLSYYKTECYGIDCVVKIQFLWYIRHIGVSTCGYKKRCIYLYVPIISYLSKQSEHD